MPGQSVATIIGGPCIMNYRGATLRSKNDVRLNLALATFPIETSLLGQVDVRLREVSGEISFVPDGEWTNLSVLWPYMNTPFGSYLSSQLPFFSVGSNQVNVGSTATLLSGDAFVAQVQGTGTITVGLTAGTTYYFHVISATNVSIHSTYAAAVAGVNPIAISAGSGNTVSVVNNPMTIQSYDGQLFTFMNVAVSKMPSLSLSTVKTPVGSVTFQAYRADGQDWSGVNSLYTSVANPWPGDATFNPNNIITGEIQAIWRNMAAPWALFDTKDGWTVDFAMDITRQEVDNVGLVAHKLSGLVVRAKATPVGVQVSDVATALQLQGAGAARGRSLGASGQDLLLSAVAANLGVKITGAALVGGPGIWSNKLDRVGELTWEATRTFGSTGPNPLFTLSGSSVT
jgi:hypothetical protein